MRAAIIGTYNSGSSALAEIMEILGFDLGGPLWCLPLQGQGENFFESRSLRALLKEWWKEPYLIEQAPQSYRVALLKSWADCHESANRMICAKHPLLCLSAPDLALAWGSDTKFIWAYRDIGESVAGLIRREWFFKGSPDMPAKISKLQQTLWNAASEFFSRSPDHLKIDHRNLKKDPKSEIIRLIQFLDLNPTDAQIHRAVLAVRR